MGTPRPSVFWTDEVVIGTAVMVRLNGELDIQYRAHVAAGFARALDRSPSVLAADLRGLRFMDSTGVHALIDAERRCRAQGVRFLVIRGSVTVNRVLAALRLNRRFEIIAGPEHLPADGADLAVAL